MITTDDRTEAQKLTHRLAVVGTDTCLSGWGQASGGKSYAGWAFRDGDMSACLAWVDGRSDMSHVRVVTLAGYYPSAAHTHIYVYNGQIIRRRTYSAQRPGNNQPERDHSQGAHQPNQDGNARSRDRE